MTPLFYLIAIVLTIFSSLSLSIYCVVKIVQVSNGFSLLDPEASSGLRIRKWFLLIVAAANGLRCVGSMTEFFAFSVKVVRDDENANSSVSYYDTKNFQSTAPYAIFISRLLPSTLHFMCYALLALYVAYLSHSIWGADFSMVRILWISCNFVLGLAVLQFMFAFPSPYEVYLLFTLTGIIYIVWLSWYILKLHRFYSTNKEDSNTDNDKNTTGINLSRSNATYSSSTGPSSGSSGPASTSASVYPSQRQQQSQSRKGGGGSSSTGVMAAAAGAVVVVGGSGTTILPSRVLTRLLFLHGIVLVVLFYGVTIHLINFSGILRHRDFYFRSTMDLTEILFGEILGTGLLVALISNHLQRAEATVCAPATTTGPAASIITPSSNRGTTAINTGRSSGSHSSTGADAGMGKHSSSPIAAKSPPHQPNAFYGSMGGSTNSSMSVSGSGNPSTGGGSSSSSSSSTRLSPGRYQYQRVYSGGREEV
mmetsp:Transcript_16012/g.26871  ORF Transcript_16012/g.26871 Transcript_16012/m.26871 type:complete len:479 (-) Transcript_16012:154-1590(-)